MFSFVMIMVRRGSSYIPSRQSDRLYIILLTTYIKLIVRYYSDFISLSCLVCVQMLS